MYKKTLQTILLALSSICLLACTSRPALPELDIDYSSLKLVQGLGESNEKVLNNIVELSETAEAQPVRAELEVISSDIEEQGVDIKTLEVAIQGNLDALENTQEIIEAKDQKIQTLQEASQKSSTKYLGMLIAFGVIIMVLGVLGFFYNAKVGIAMLGIGGVTVAVTAATMYYMGWFALIGLVTMGSGLLLLIIYLAWALFRGRVFSGAFKENVDLIEVIKQELPVDKKGQIFGEGLKPGLAQSLQSAATIAEVSKIRKSKKA